MLNNAKYWAPRGAWRYAAALVAALAAFGARELMHPVLEAHMPALFFTIASVMVGFSLGIGPAVLVVIVGVPVADYYFVLPYANFGSFDKEDVILFVGFPSATLFFLGMIEWLRRTQHEARLLGEVARARHGILVRAEKRRKEAEASYAMSNRLIRQFTDGSGDVLFVGKVGSRYEYVSEALSSEITECEGKSATARLFATLSSDDAATFAAALRFSHDRRPRSWTMSLPRKDSALSDLVCQLERFPTDHGAYVVMRVLPKVAV
jgi:K+-sensing histidine kinase KdpD